MLKFFGLLGNFLSRRTVPQALRSLLFSGQCRCDALLEVAVKIPINSVLLRGGYRRSQHQDTGIFLSPPSFVVCGTHYKGRNLPYSF